MPTPPFDLIPARTGDGSFTLESRILGERYHSIHGAVAESRHVYIEHGLVALDKGKIDLLEVGLGTGLNALLTWIEADDRSLQVDQLALEPWSVPLDVVRVLDHPSALGHAECSTGFERMMQAGEGMEVGLSPNFRFRCSRQPVQMLDAEAAFGLVYFDAFAPAVQPEMWTLDVFRRLHRAMRPKGMLVTYCAKGAVRRTMIEAGFAVERLKGPPGKHEMLRATRPE